MAHKHDGTLYYIIVNDKTGETEYDSWANVLTFDTEDDAKDYIEDFEMIGYHIETWLDY